MIGNPSMPIINCIMQQCHGYWWSQSSKYAVPQINLERWGAQTNNCSIEILMTSITAAHLPSFSLYVWKTSPSMQIEICHFGLACFWAWNLNIHIKEIQTKRMIAVIPLKALNNMFQSCKGWWYKQHHCNLHFMSVRLMLHSRQPQQHQWVFIQVQYRATKHPCWKDAHWSYLDLTVAWWAIVSRWPWETSSASSASCTN